MKKIDEARTHLVLRRERPMQVVLFVALVALIAACASNGDEPEAAPDPATETDDGAVDGDAEEDTPPDWGGVVVSMASGEKQLPMIGDDAAEALGIFDDLGMEVEVLGGTQVVEAMLAGEVHIGLAAPNSFTGAIRAGAPFTIVGPTMDAWDQYIIVRKDLGLNEPSDWRGGVISTTRFGSAGHFAAEKLAEALGWEESDWELVTVGDVDGLLGSLRGGTADGFMASAQFAYRLEEEGVADVIGSMADVIDPIPLDIIVVHNDVIEERPHTVRAWCEAYYEGQRRMIDDYDTALGLMINEWGYEDDLADRILEEGVRYLSTSDEITSVMFDGIAEATNFTVDGVDDMTADEVASWYVPCSEL